MAESALIADTVPPEQRALMFPKLTEEQISRVAAHGRPRHLRPGEVLVEPGDVSGSLFVVKTGR
ncbi:MAG TPA: hypothetical protein VH138_02385, partial [Vicinamibacterales bacterium]|nr:hypothetical protein [Vicinamibacterales bacterium]